MICDNCFDRATCQKRRLGGKHIDTCVMYFPDLSPLSPRTPLKIMTPEDRRPPIETRET